MPLLRNIYISTIWTEKPRSEKDETKNTRIEGKFRMHAQENEFDVGKL